MDSEKLFRSFDTLLSIVPDPLIMLDREGRFTYCNQAALNVIGITFDEAIGTRPREHHSLPPETISRLESNLERVRASKKPLKDLNEITTTDGIRLYEYVLSPLLQPDGELEGFTVSKRDITDQVEEKKKLSGHVQQLKLEQRLREQFVDTLTHDLRNPLAIARLCAQILGKKTHDPETSRKLCEQINENIDRADIMIRDLLDSSRIRAGEKLHLEIRACQMDQVVFETLKDLRTIHGDRFVFQPEELIRGYWSEKDIRRALENLAHNAVKYGAENSPITIRISSRNHLVELSVHNEGTPIPLNEQTKLFGPFHRAESARLGKQNGWGLGLVLIKGIAEAHGGEVTFESLPQIGTTFRILLPLDSRSSITSRALPY